LVNVSVWQDLESLSHYVYRSAHVEILRRRSAWFERMSEAFLVLWWIPKGHRPGVPEALSRLEQLRSNGPTPEGFTFSNAFAAPDSSLLPAPEPPPD